MLIFGFLCFAIVIVMQGLDLHRTNKQLNDVTFTRNRLQDELDKRRQFTTLLQESCVIQRDPDGHIPMLTTQMVCEQARRKLLEQVERGIVTQRTELPDGLKVQASIIIVSPREIFVATKPQDHETNSQIRDMQLERKRTIVPTEP